MIDSNYQEMLAVALEQARLDLSEGGMPIGAALSHRDGRFLGQGHNRWAQEDNPSVHGETDVFCKAGRRCHYRDTVLVTPWPHAGIVVD